LRQTGEEEEDMKYGSAILADIHHNMLEGLRVLLESTFSTVVMVADLNSLYDAVNKIHPDLVVVDLSMATKCEANIAVKIKELHPDLRFIVLSIHDDQDVARKILDAGSMAYVLKRSTATDLLPAIESAMKGKKFISPEMYCKIN
jgi:DNA-binding NarL/FixJ family response regulator